MKLIDLILANQQNYYDKIIRVSKKQTALHFQLNKNIYQKIKYAYYTRKKNVLAPKRNIWIQGRIGDNIRINHANVIINRYTTVGNNVTFRGNNCLGNDGKDNKNCPKVGNNVTFCYGACAYGNIAIEDNVVIAAGAIVVKDCEKNGVYAGIPARRIK